MSEEKVLDLGNAKISKLMAKYAIPCIISLLVAALYNIVDQIFIANSYLGSYGNAANTVVYPLTVIALAVAVMIGDGSCAYVSISLGKNEKEKANQSVGNAIILSVLAGLIIMIVYLCFRSPIVNAFGGNVNQETYEKSMEYFLYIAIGIPFYVFGQAANPIIRSDGNPRFAMIATTTGAVLNLILDPVFIYACKWGMMGAAIATVLGQVLTAGLSIYYFFHMHIIQLNQNSFKLNWEVIKKMIPLGICSFLSQISLVAAMAAINNMIAKYGPMDERFASATTSQIPMAVVGIVMKFFQIVISIVVGMAAGIIPIVGFNMGSGRKDRVKELFTKLLILEAVVGAVALFIVEVLPGAIMAIFGAANESAEYLAFGKEAFRIYLCMIVFACVNKASFIFLQAMGKAIASTMLSMIREIIFGVGFALLLPLFFNLRGVLYSMPLSDILTFIISVIIIIQTYQELNKKEEKI